MTLADYITYLKNALPLCETDEDARWLAAVIDGLEWLAARA